jgi:hypothetical protein
MIFCVTITGKHLVMLWKKKTNKFKLNIFCPIKAKTYKYSKTCMSSLNSPDDALIAQNILSSLCFFLVLYIEWFYLFIFQLLITFKEDCEGCRWNIFSQG